MFWLNINSLSCDGLPIAYTREELYDKVVQLKTDIKKDKQQLVELQSLFLYVSKMMDSVAETSFLGNYIYRWLSIVYLS